MPDHATIARQAAELIETNGWCQGDYYPEEDKHLPANERRMDISGAINHATGGNARTSSPEGYHIETVMIGYYQIITADSLTDWNDHPDRTASEVVAALRAFADAHEAAGGEQ